MGEAERGRVDNTEGGAPGGAACERVADRERWISRLPLGPSPWQTYVDPEFNGHNWLEELSKGMLTTYKARPLRRHTPPPSPPFFHATHPSVPCSSPVFISFPKSHAAHPLPFRLMTPTVHTTLSKTCCQTSGTLTPASRGPGPNKSPPPSLCSPSTCSAFLIPI